MAVDSGCYNRLPSLKFVGDTLSVSAYDQPGDHDLVIFNLEPGAPCCPWVQPSYRLWCFWDLLFSTYDPNTCQTDHLTLRP